MEDNNRFYVYIYLDPRKQGDYIYGQYSFEFQPLYIGKGSGDRYLHHLRDALNPVIELATYHNRLKLASLRKLLKLDIDMYDYILKVATGITEDRAIQIESELIKAIGMRSNNTGVLTNLTIGGYGATGYKYSDKQKAERREHIIARYARTGGMVEEAKVKLSASTKAWIRNNPELAKVRQAKATAARSTIAFREQNRKIRIEWMKANPSKCKALQKKATDAAREWGRHNPEAVASRVDAAIAGHKAMFGVTKLIKARCNTLIERFHLDVKRIHHNCNIKKWLAFEAYLITLCPVDSIPNGKQERELA